MDKQKILRKEANKLVDVVESKGLSFSGMNLSEKRGRIDLTISFDVDKEEENEQLPDGGDGNPQ